MPNYKSLVNVAQFHTFVWLYLFLNTADTAICIVWFWSFRYYTVMESCAKKVFCKVVQILTSTCPICNCRQNYCFSAKPCVPSRLICYCLWAWFEGPWYLCENFFTPTKTYLVCYNNQRNLVRASRHQTIGNVVNTK